MTYGFSKKFTNGRKDVLIKEGGRRTAYGKVLKNFAAGGLGWLLNVLHHPMLTFRLQTMKIVFIRSSQSIKLITRTLLTVKYGLLLMSSKIV